MNTKCLSYEQVVTLLDENHGKKVFGDRRTKAIPHIVHYIQTFAFDSTKIARGFEILQSFGRTAVGP